MSKNNRANRQRKQRLKQRKSGLAKAEKPFERMVAETLVENRPARTALAVTYTLHQIARPLPADGVVEPGSLLLDGGSKGQLYVHKQDMPEVIQGFRTEVGLSLEELEIAFAELQAKGVIHIVEGDPSPVQAPA